jgi:hypothetical protein
VVDAVRTAPVEDVEIIVVDDGSTDERTSEAKPHGWVHKPAAERNFGKGAVCVPVFKQRRRPGHRSRCDLEYDPSEYPILLSLILEIKDVVFGSRFWRQASSGGLLLAYGGKPFSHVTVQHVYKLEPTDMETCYKLFRREFLDGITIREPVWV